MKEDRKVNIYEKLFQNQIHQRIEYGNIESNLKYFKKFNINKKSNILDIGCNIGSFVFELDKIGWHNSHGIDITTSAVNLGKKKYKSVSSRLYVYDGFKIPFENNYFDVITIFDVLEHIPHLDDFLLEMYRVLKKGGIVIFQTPNKIINIPWEIISNKSFSHYKKYHCSLQTFSSLKKKLRNKNFKDIKIEKVDINTKYNRDKVKKNIGNLGICLLKITPYIPLKLYPNFFGNCRK